MSAHTLSHSGDTILIAGTPAFIQATISFLNIFSSLLFPHNEDF
jgi:hypothetical protein